MTASTGGEPADGTLNVSDPESDFETADGFQQIHKEKLVFFFPFEELWGTLVIKVNDPNKMSDESQAHTTVF